MNLKFGFSSPKLGIIGGGQLGKMLAIEAKRWGIYIIVMDPSENCPASSICDEFICNDFKDGNAIISLASKVDVLTYEIELVNATILAQLENQGKIIHPDPASLFIIQNKLRQRTFLKNNALPVPLFYKINSLIELKSYLKSLNNQAMLKIAEGSYDGRGNIVLTPDSNLEEIYNNFSTKEIFIEEWVDFMSELSILVARNPSGEIKTYPVVENFHENSILDISIAPARIDHELLEKIDSIAKSVLEHLKGAGIFCIELFLTKSKNILINEIAPRVHNSGHYTIEACETNQFQQHLRAIFDFPLGSTKLIRPAVMVNLLGIEKDGKSKIEGLMEALAIPNTFIHIYGKENSRTKRKMGHITITGETIPEALEKINKVKKVIKISGD